MKLLHRLLVLAVSAAAIVVTSSCQTLDKEPEPEREQLSSMPHNKPESWEGQAGMPGFMGAQGQY